MGGYVDEKVAKVTLNNKEFTMRIQETIQALDRLKKAFNKVSDGSKVNGIGKGMNRMTDEVNKSVRKSESLLSRLKGIFRRSTSNIDMSGAGRSIDRMNTDIANKTSRTSSILSRIKNIFRRADTTDGFPNASGSIDKLNGIISSKTSITANILGRIKSMFQRADQGVDFRGSMSAIDKLNSKVATADASPLVKTFQSAASGVQQSLSIMDVAVGNFVGGLMSKGLSKLGGFAKSFTHGMTDGMAEYGEKLGSVQTILTNTQWEGKNINDVTNALSDLNTYADQTIYSFADMTKNIGTFTAAGVGLEKSKTAIKGIANLAAASGSSTLQAGTAMYQLSQALASGKVNLQDWNSVVNAGMGGKLFKDALMETGKAMGKNIDASKNFRDTLQDGWLTADVLLETLDKFSKDPAMLDAATKVKSFSQLVDTAREAIGSGWAETWELVFGNFNQAKELWTGINDVLAPLLGDTVFDGYKEGMSNFRNEMLKVWQSTGGQKAFFNSLKNGTTALVGSLMNLRNGWRDVMGGFREQGLALTSFSKGLEQVTQRLAKSTAMMSVFKTVGQTAASIVLLLGKGFGKFFSGLFDGIGGLSKLGDIFVTVISVIKNFTQSLAENRSIMGSIWNIGRTLGFAISALISIFHAAFTVVKKFFGVFKGGNGGISEGIYETTYKIMMFAEKVKDFADKIDKAAGKMKVFSTAGEIVRSVFKGLGTAIGWAFNGIGKLFSKTSGAGNGIGAHFKSLFSKIGSGISSAVDNIKSKLGAIGRALQTAGQKIAQAWNWIASHWKSGVNQFISAVKSLGIADIIKGVIALFALDKWVSYKNGKKSVISMVLDKAKEAFETFTSKGDGLVKRVGDILGSFKGAVDQFAQGFKITQLVLIAGATLMLAHAIKMLSQLEMHDISKGMIGMGSSAIALVASFSKIAKAVNGIPRGTASTLIALAISIRIMASAFAKAGEVDSNKLSTAIGGIVASMITLVSGMRLLSKIGNTEVTMIKLMGLASSLYIMTLALKKIADIKPERLIGSLGSLTVLMLSLATTMKLMNKISVPAKTTLSIFTLSAVLVPLSLVAALLGKIKWNEALQGVASLSALMLALSTATRIMNGVSVPLKTSLSLIPLTIAIGGIAGLALLLSRINWMQAVQSTASLSVLMLSLSASVRIMNQMKPPAKALASILALSGGLYVICTAIQKIAFIPLSELINTIGSVTILMSALVASTAVLKTFRSPGIGNVVSILAFSGGIYLISLSIEKLAYKPWSAMAKGLSGVGIILGALVGVSYIVKGIKVNVSSIAMIGAYVGAIYALMTPIETLAKLNPVQMVSSVASISGVFVSLAYTSKVISNTSASFEQTLTVAGIVKAFGSFLESTGKALETISKIGWVGLTSALVSIGVTLEMLVLLLKQTSKVKGDVGELAALAANMKIAGDALAKLASLPWTSLLAATVSLAGTMTVLVGAAKVMSGIPAGAAFKLILLSTSLMGFAVPIKILSSVGLIGVALGIGAMAANITLLCIAAAFASPLSVGLMSLSRAMMAFGAATILASVSFAFTAAGFLAFATAIKGLVEIAPAAFKGIVESIDIFFTNLAAKGPSIMSAFVKIIREALKGLSELIPEFVLFGLKALTGVLKGLTQGLPELSAFAVKFMLEFGKALIDNMETLVDTGLKVATEFVKHLANALEKAVPQLVPSLGKLLKNAIKVVMPIFKEGLVPLIEGLVEAFRPIVDIILNVLNEVAQAIEPILTPIAETLQTLFESIAVVVKSLADAIISLIDGISSVVHEFGATIRTIFESVASVINDVAMTIQNVSNDICNVIIAALQTIDNIVTTITNGIVLTVQIAGATLENIVSIVINGIVAAIQSLGGVFESIGNAIRSALEGVAAVVESIGNAIRSAFEGIGKAIESTGEAIKSILQGVGDAFEKLGSGIEHALHGASDVIQSLGRAIKDALAGAADIIRSIGEASKDAGAGFKNIGEGVGSIMSHNILDLGAHLYAVSKSIRDLANSSSGIQSSAEGISQLGEAFGKLSDGTLSNLASNLTNVTACMPTLASSFAELPAHVIASSEAFNLFSISIQNGVISAIPLATLAVTQMGQAVQLSMQNSLQGGEITGQRYGESVGGGIGMGSSLAQINASQLGLLANQSVQLPLDPVSAALIGSGFGMGISSGIGGQTGSVASASSGLGMSAFTGATGSLNSANGMGLGGTFGMGVNSGISGQIGSVAGTSTNLANSGVHAVRGGFGIANSLGTNFGSGVSGGVRGQIGNVVGSSSTMANSGSNAVSRGFSGARGIGTTFGSNVAGGVRGQSSNVRGAGAHISSAGASGARSYSWYGSGSSLASGLASGISSMWGHVMGVASSLARAASNAIKSALKINSPSKVTMEYGKYFGEGFSIGIADMIGDTEKVATAMGVKSMNALNESMSIINDFIDRDMDITPTITPVVDLTNLKDLEDLSKVIDIGAGSAINRNNSQTPVYNSSTTNNKQNSYNVNIEVSTATNASPRDIAEQIDYELRRRLDRNRWSTGDLVY